MVDIILGLVFIGLSGLVYLLMRDFPTAKIIEGLGPGFMPSFLIILLIALSLVLIVTGILKRKKITAGGKSETDFAFSVMKAPAILLLSIFAYLILLQYLGFVISTPFLVLASMKIMGAKTKMALLMAIVLTGAIYIFFAILFQVSLPRGSIF